jgi:hypothetical protein
VGKDRPCETGVEQAKIRWEQLLEDHALLAAAVLNSIQCLRQLEGDRHANARTALRCHCEHYGDAL